MTIQEFRCRRNQVKKNSKHLDFVERNQRLINFCKSVYDECLKTMKDCELEKMLSEYHRSLDYNRDMREDALEVLDMREQVCRRMAEQSFPEYGMKWAGSLIQRGHYSNEISSLVDYERAISVYNRLKRECHYDVNKRIASCCALAALLCESENMHERTIWYNNRTIKSLNKKNTMSKDDLFDIGSAYKMSGEAYMRLGQYEESRACFNNAIKTFTKRRSILNDQVEIFFNGAMIDASNSFLNELNASREEY